MSRLVVMLFAGLGAALAIYVLAEARDWTGIATLIPSFGASCVLVFAIPDSPFAQPRNVIGGHAVSSVAGLAVLTLIGHGSAAMAIGVGLAVVGMMVTRTMHPPAGGDPLIIIMTTAPLSFLVTPILVGTIVIVVIGAVYRRALGAFGKASISNMRKS